MTELLAAAALVAAAVAAGFLWRRTKTLERGNRDLRAAVETAEEVLATSPDGLFLWDCATGRERCSRRLAVLLGLGAGTAATFADVRACFGGTAASALDGAVDALRRSGAAFDLDLPLADGARTIRAAGMRAEAADGRALADLVWMRAVAPGPADGERADDDHLEDRFRALLDALPLPLWLRDGDLDIAFTNRAFDRELDGDPARDLAERALARGRAVSENRLAAGDDRSRLLEMAETPVPGWPGTAGIAIDRSSPRGRATDDGGPAPDPLCQVLDALPVAVAVYGADARLAAANPPFAALWDLDGAWLAGHPTYGEVLDALRERRRLPEFADFRAFRDEQLAQFETLSGTTDSVLHLPDGSAVRSVVSPHPAGGLVCVYDDVSDRLELERSYRALDAVARETLDNLHEGIAVFGSDGRLRLSNPMVSALWGLGADDPASDLHVSDFVERMRPLLAGVEDWPAHKAQILASLLGRKPAAGRLARADGRVVDFANVPLPDGAVLISYRDVTDSVRVERALRERAGALHEADRLKSEFIANVSHEIRTPLTSIIGFAQVLADEYFGPLNPRQKEYSRDILDSAQALTAVVDDILDLATIEAGLMTLELDTVDLHPMLAGVLTLVRERARQRQLAIAFDCPSDMGWAVIDQRRIRQVVFTLLSNAIGATPAGGTVRLAAARDDDDVVITVSDGGPGVPASERATVFHPFAGGTGLGLSLVDRFVALHGGCVELSSTGRGTAVTCRIPAERQAAGDEEPSVDQGKTGT